MITPRNGTGLMGRGTAIRPRFPAPLADLRILSHGDSISRDSAYSNYLYQLKALILSERNEVAAIIPRGINGISYNYRWEGEPYNQTMLTDAPISIDPLLASSLPTKLIVFAGTNGIAIGGHSAATEYGHFKTYIAARIAAGIEGEDILVVPMLPRAGVTDATRQTLNGYFVGDDGGYGYQIVPIHLDPDMGGEGDHANTTYFYDGIHPTTAGHGRLALTGYNTIYP